MKRIIFSIATVLMVLATLTACGSPPQWAKLPAPEDNGVQAPIEKPDPARQQIRQLLSEQDHAGAIDLIRVELQKGVDEQGLAREYLQAANGALGQADVLMKRGQYAKAAVLLKTVRDNFPRAPELQKQIVASPTQITTDIDRCTQNLMEAGLVAYRAGELATALGLWQQILAISPQHQAAKNASQTTQQQLLKLKTLNGKN